MKKRLYIRTALSLMSVALLSSCLKNSKYYVDFQGATPMVELPSAANVGGGGGAVQSLAFDIKSTPTPFTIPVNLASPHTLGSALTVKLSVDQGALDKYNAANEAQYLADSAKAAQAGTALPSAPIMYTVLPAADFSSTLTVTIPAGQNLTELTVNVNTSAIDPSQSYILPLTITDGGGQAISPNYKTILFAVQVKNKYDGEYTVTGSLVDVTTTTITGAYPEDVDLITTGAATDAFFDTTYGNAHAITSSGSTSVYGAFDPQFTFDLTTNKVIGVVNFVDGAPHARSAALVNAGTFTSTGTPGTKGFKFTVSYVLHQGDLGIDRTQFDETFTYVGPR